MTRGGSRAVPEGYVRFRAGQTEVVSLCGLEEPIRKALLQGTLYDYARRHPRARAMQGRGPVYAAPLPDLRTRAVIRRSRRGGLLAPLTGDRFLGGTRASRELETAVRLAHSGVPTPQIIATAQYPAGPFMRRGDVATREIEGSKDLAQVLLAQPDAAARRAALAATAHLLAGLAAAGARHPDLNLKNVLLTRAPDARMLACVLDVDRITFHVPGDSRVTHANLRRLARSARKWRDLHAAPVDEQDLAWLAGEVLRLAPA